jgi:hypothetical protein
MSLLERFIVLNVTRRRVALVLPLIVAAACSDADSTAPRRAATPRASATIDPLTPTLSVTPTTLNFAPQPPNAMSAQQVVTVRNTGSADVHLTTLSWDGGAFRVVTDCFSVPNHTLVPGAECHFGVTFGTWNPGYYYGTIVIGSDATPNAPQTVSLNGIVSGTPQVTVTPGSLGFGSVWLGTATSERVVKITNTGTASVVIASVNLGGANAGDFDMHNTTCTVVVPLAPGLSCYTYVTFEPSRLGARSASITIMHTAPGGSTVVPITGTGVKPPGGIIP